MKLRVSESLVFNLRRTKGRKMSETLKELFQRLRTFFEVESIHVVSSYVHNNELTVRFSKGAETFELTLKRIERKDAE